MPPLKVGAQLASMTSLAVPASTGASLMAQRGNSTGTVVQNQSFYIQTHRMGSPGPNGQRRGRGVSYIDVSFLVALGN